MIAFCVQCFEGNLEERKVCIGSREGAGVEDGAGIEEGAGIREGVVLGEDAGVGKSEGEGAKVGEVAGALPADHHHSHQVV